MVSSAEPTLRNLNVRGLQVGGTTTLVLDGDDLGKAPKLLLPFPARQTLGPKSTDKQATFDVSLDAAVAPGYYHLRVVTDGGVSLPVLVGVDKLPQKPLAPPSPPGGKGPSPESLPVALHGSVTGSTVVEAAFAGKAGQKVLVEVEAQRLGSKLRPVTHLYSPKKLQLAWSWATPVLLGDTRLEATLPEDGTYTVAVHDAEYAGQTPGFFRLKIGQWNYADRVFPPVAGADTRTVELIGNTPAKLDLSPKRDPLAPLPWPKDGTWSGPRPFVEVSPRPELSAGDGGLSGMLRVGPFAVSDRLDRPFQEARFRVPVVPNTKVRFEVFAERLGSPLDAALVVRDEKDNQLVRAEDSPGTLDPVVEYAVPDKVTAVVVGVVESQGRANPGGMFRLTVDPASPGVRLTDYELVTPTQRVALPAGGKWVVPVFAERRGFAGKIDLSAAGLPAGVKLDGAAIPAEADGTLVTVTRAAGSADATITTWTGRGAGGLDRPVALKGHPLDRFQPWLATELAVAPTTAKAGEFAVEWRGLPDTAGIIPAGKLPLPVKVTRPDPASPVRLTLLTGKLPLPVKVTRPDPASPVRLTLLTSQLPPVNANNQPDPNRAIRPEKPVELGAKAADGEVVAVIPGELPSPVYDVAIQAELLSADKQRVLATAFTPVKRLAVRIPIALKLTSPAKIAVTLDPKKPPAVEVKGDVVRSEGFAGDVTVTLAGLPAGIQAAPVTVKAGTTAFAVKFTVPPTTPPGETRGLKLSATAVTDPKQPNVRVKSREVEQTLSITR